MIREYFLPDEEMVEVLECITRNDMIIGGAVDLDNERLILYTGSLQKVFAPFKDFEPSGTGLCPDFTQFKVIDWGWTVALGDYEAASDAILEERRIEYDAHRRNTP